MLYTVVHEISVNKSDTTRQSHGQIGYKTANTRTNKIRHGKHAERSDTTRQAHGEIGYNTASTRTKLPYSSIKASALVLFNIYHGRSLLT